jgi:hypothetical protein
LLAIPVAATASPFTHAEYTVAVSAVATFNQPSGPVASASDQQESLLAQPATSQVSGQALYGSVDFGYGNGHASAIAKAGELRAFASAESQAVARPDSNVGSGVVSTALAEFADELTFTPAHSVYQDLLIINGELILTGDMNRVGPGSSYLLVAAGGTGLAQSTAAEWIGEMGLQKSPGGVYSPWTPGDPVAIPFSFTVYADQPSEIDYWLRVHADSSQSFDPCPASGPLCDVSQIGNQVASSDYSHTMTWHLTSATDWFQTAVDVGITSSSGFDYLLPEPGEGASLLVAMVTLAAMRKRRRARR